MEINCHGCTNEIDGGDLDSGVFVKNRYQIVIPFCARCAGYIEDFFNVDLPKRIRGE